MSDDVYDVYVIGNGDDIHYSYVRRGDESLITRFLENGTLMTVVENGRGLQEAAAKDLTYKLINNGG